MALIILIALEKKLTPISKLLVKISRKKRKSSVLEIEKNVFQFKMSAPMVGHFGKRHPC